MIRDTRGRTFASTDEWWQEVQRQTHLHHPERFTPKAPPMKAEEPQQKEETEVPKVEKASETSGVRSTVIPGEHVLTLIEVREVSGENKFAEPVGTKPDGTPQYPVRDQFLWVFQSDKHDAEGAAQEYAIYTGRRYGDERAKLTDLLNLMMPDADDDARGSLDTDTLLGRTFRARIHMVTTRTGKKIPQHLFMEPVEKAPA